MRVVREKALDLHAAVRKWSRATSAEPAVHRPAVRVRPGQAPGDDGGEETRRGRAEGDGGADPDCAEPARRTEGHGCGRVELPVQGVQVPRRSGARRQDRIPGRCPPNLSTNSRRSTSEARRGAANNPYKLRVLRRSRGCGNSPTFWNRTRSSTRTPSGPRAQDPLKKELAELHAIRDPSTPRGAESASSTKDAVPGKTGKEVQFSLLHEAIPLSPRVGEAFTVELLQLVPAALAAWPPPNRPRLRTSPKKQGELLQRCPRRRRALRPPRPRQETRGRVLDPDPQQEGEDRFKLINVVGGQSLRV